MGRVSNPVRKILLLTLLTACGKPVPENTAPPPDVGLPVVGVAGFGSQCPYGFTEDPFPVKLEAWNCPVGLDQMELIEPLTPLYLQVDCKKKFVSVRKPNRKMDTSWEIMPDGAFFMTVDGGFANLKADGPGRSKCATPLTVNLMGKIDCSDRDKASIDMESVFWLGKAPPTPSASPSPGASASPIPGPAGGSSIAAVPDSGLSTCSKIPTGCYFYAKTLIKQCR